MLNHYVVYYFSSNYGRVLLLDGAVQLTERDEASYQEMMAFMPLNSHPNPQKVSISLYALFHTRSACKVGIIYDIDQVASKLVIINCAHLTHKTADFYAILAFYSFEDLT